MIITRTGTHTTIQFFFSVTLLLGVFWFFGQRAYADCDTKGICKIERPITNTANGPLSPFYYKRIFRNSKYPTIVFFNGGPGAPSIDAETLLPRFSKTANLILTDMRGSGRNKYNWEPMSINIPNVANDMVAVILDAQLQDFIIYGASFGTIVATVVAHKLEEQKIYPKSVVLEGTAGKAYSYNSPSVYDAGLELWNSVKPRLNTHCIDSLDDGSGYLGVKYGVWGAAILNILIHQSWPTSFNSLKTIFDSCSEKAKYDSLRNVVQVWAVGGPRRVSAESPKKAFGGPKKNGSDSVAESETQELETYIREIRSDPMNFIRCDELGMHPHVGPLRYYREKLELLPWDEKLLQFDRCNGSLNTSPFDSSNWTYTTKTYYIQGQNDPNTPMWQATYHYDHSRSDKKYFLPFKSQGHDVLASISEKCRDRVWESILKGEEPLLDQKCTN